MNLEDLEDVQSDLHRDLGESAPTDADAEQTRSDSVHQIAESLFSQVVAEGRLSRPRATYRLQVHKDFTFAQVTEILDYLRDLGISDTYFSPYLEARPGSTHGYDVFDHTQVNPEIGGEAEHNSLCEQLDERQMRRILDVVPNHMGISGPNRYWLDVLENGPLARSHRFFDIDWQPIKEELTGRVLLPILGDQYGQVLESGQLQLVREGGSFHIQYYEHSFPLTASSYAFILRARLDTFLERFDRDDLDVKEYLSILASAEYLPSPGIQIVDAAGRRSSLLERDVIQRRISRLCTDRIDLREFLDQTVASFQGVPGDPSSFDALHEILENQHYRLSNWRVASEEINYRRFFDINDLAGLRAEDPIVFAETHQRILEWVTDGGVSSLRIDHPDGLADPTGYFGRLQQQAFLSTCQARFLEQQGSKDSESTTSSKPVDWNSVRKLLLKWHAEHLADPESGFPKARLPIYAEKILSRGEDLPEDWPIDGTVGYEYLNALNGIFVDSSGQEVLDQAYREFTEDTTPFSETVYVCKQVIARTALASELNTLARGLNRVSESNRSSRDFTLNELRRVVREVLSCFPVYRTYWRSGEPISTRDQDYIVQAVARARKRNPTIDASVFEFLRQALLLEHPETRTEVDREILNGFVTRFQQTSGPIKAKGLEDTAFYRYVRLISLNEVGGDPTRFGTSLQSFHALNSQRLDRWPGLSTTATHDTKRGEDTRLRINVLSELAGEWKTRLNRWKQWNKRKKNHQDLQVPDALEEYLFYQILVGTWPLEAMDPPGESRPQVDPEYVSRIQAYMVKAIREAKRNTSWTDADPTYADLVSQFVEEVLTSSDAGPFLNDLIPFADRVARIAMVHSLTQSLVKITSPGVPDIYQGCELWDLSLVDPDNRRPVNFALRLRLLNAIRGQTEIGTPRAEVAKRLLEEPESGAVKMYVLYTALQDRKARPELYQSGTYRALDAEGPAKTQLVGLQRQWEGQVALVVAPRLVASMVDHDAWWPIGNTWAETTLSVPESLVGTRLRNTLTDEVIEVGSHRGAGVIAVDQVLANFPVALLV